MVMAYSAQHRVTVILGGAAGSESPNGQVRLLIVHGAKPPANTADEFEFHLSHQSPLVVGYIRLNKLNRNPMLLMG